MSGDNALISSAKDGSVLQYTCEQEIAFDRAVNSQGGSVCMHDVHRNSKTSQRIKDGGRSIETSPINSLCIYITHDDEPLYAHMIAQ